jgi:hypothetical protein
MKITSDFSTETLKARKAWCDVFQALIENKQFQSYNTLPRKAISQNWWRNKSSMHDRQKLKQYMTNNHQYRRF